MDLDSFKLKNIPVPQTQTRQIDNLNISSGSQNPDSINYTENLTIKYIQPEIITKRPIYMYPIAFIQNIFPRRRFISFLIVVLFVFSLVFFILYFKQIFINRHRITYNSKYPLSNIYHDQLNTYSEFIFLTVVMVSDEDKASRIQFDSPGNLEGNAIGMD
ncbi:hypothetical protein A3Q56_06466 [Intoshia linei]|uniref:Uncharacterized protein n=1 Tax=Intoshia linei TaxID=1819745 RepID=A0A177AV14_9BILA|nr:hypothetical protein A3Q56_06466 [Intoshia linei]